MSEPQRGIRGASQLCDFECGYASESLRPVLDPFDDLVAKLMEVLTPSSKRDVGLAKLSQARQDFVDALLQQER